LLREVYLRPVQEVDISRVQVRTPLASPTSAATIDEQVVLRNPTGRAQTVVLSGRYGSLPLRFGTYKLAAGTSRTVTATATLNRPHLWAIGDPHLYRDTLTLTDAKQHRLTGYVTYSGVRTIAVTSDGRLTLNGRLLNLRGVNIHEQDLSEGAALDPAHLRRIVSLARFVGATIIRAHYPLNPQIEELADEDGILLWSEIPVYQTNSAYLTQPAWVANAHATLQNNIETNQNHPSILLWSIANELETPPPASEATYIAGAAALAHKLDPTRPIGMAIASWPGVACQAAYAPLDVLGFNDYFGWYDAGGGTTDDRDELSPFLDSYRACYPKKALFVSEFGFEANRNGPVEERGTYQFQANAVAFHLGVFASKPWLSGAIYFPLQDFAVTPGWGGGNPYPDPPFLHKGLFDLQGNAKPAEPIVSANFHSTRQIAPVSHSR
jgi:beta-glucuronidase